MDDNVNGVQTDDQSTNTNLFYQLFRSTGIPMEFAMLVLIRWLIAMCGFVLNICLFYVTIRTRFLFGTCNFLIGFNAFCAAMTSPFMTIGLVVVLGRIGFISIWSCFSLQLIPMLFSNLFIFSMFAIGADRLLSILYPIWHSQRNKFNYLTSILIICFFYAFVVIFLCYVGVMDHLKFVVLCSNPGEVYQGEIANVLFRLNLAVISMTILCYIILWALIRRKKAQLNGTFTQKNWKSLLCMVVVITLGYFLSTSIRILAPYVALTQSQVAYFAFVTSIFSILAMGINGPILFIFSQDYRKAFRKQFPRIFHSHVSFGSNMALTRVAPIGGATAAVTAATAHNREHAQF